MPSTVLGLVLFVVGLAPGLAFVLLRERVAPQRALSPFRETAIVLCVSIAAAVFALALFAVLRAAAPSITPDVGSLVRDPAQFVRTSYVSLFWWSIALLGLATAAAGLVGSGALRRLLARLPRSPVDPVLAPHEAGVSAWWLAFRDQPDADVHVGCLLTDGSFVSGFLMSFSNAAEDSGDRDLTLAADLDRPIKFRAAGQLDTVELPGVGAVVVAARQTSLIFVSYLPKPAVSGPDG